MLHLAATTAAPSRKRNSVDDDAFLDALGFDFRNVTDIARQRLANGTPASPPTIRKRMMEFAAYTPEIEGKGYSWRLTPEAPANDNGDVPPLPPATGNRKGRRAAKAVETIQPVSANDNPATVLPIGLHQMCGLELMRSLPDASVDLLLTDLPYGETRAKFDPKINVAEWMAEMRRIVTNRGAILAFCAQPFTTDLINAGRDMLKTDIVWEKPMATGFPQSHRRMMKAHETILVFSKGTVCGGGRSKRTMTYNPQGAEAYVSPNRKHIETDYQGQPFSTKAAVGDPVDRLRNCPRDVVYYPKDQGTGHSFSKPVALLEMLIRTYSNEGDVVLDPTMGSGSTGVACLPTGRQFIGAENGCKKNGDCIFTIAKNRIAAASVEVPVPANDQQAHVPPPEPSNDNITPTIVGDATLYQADCLAAMRAMPSESVDIIFTSPPYNLREHKSSRGDWKGPLLCDGYETFSDDMPRHAYVAWQKQVLTECWRLLKPTGAIFYNHKQRGVKGKCYDPRDLNPGLPLLQSLIWDRKSGHNPTRHRFLPTHEEILIFAKPKFRLREGKTGTKTVWDVLPETSKNKHPAPFPVELVMKALDSTNGPVIFDPFMGSGTTGVAALRAGRQFIGVEIGPKTFKGAVKRIGEAA